MEESLEVYPYRRKFDAPARGRIRPAAGSPPKESRHDAGGDRKPAKKRPVPGPGRLPSLRQAALVLALGFFLGRAALMGELWPFGVAFVAATQWVFPRAGVVSLVAAVAGQFSLARDTQSFLNVAVLALAWLAAGGVPRGTRHGRWVVAGLAAGIDLAVKVGWLAFAHPSLYAYVTVLFEGAFTCALTFLFSHALLWLQRRPGAAGLSLEGFIPLLILFAGVVAGAGGLSVGPVTLKGFLGRTAVLFAAGAGGGGLGAAAGAVVGVLPVVGYVLVPGAVGAYAFTGLVAGACRALGRLGVVLGFLVASIILALYVVEPGQLHAVLAETGGACLVYLLVPARWLDSFRIWLPLAPAEPACTLHVTPAGEGGGVARRLQNWAHVFQELARTFQYASQVKRRYEEERLQAFIAAIGARVCETCSFYRNCWEREFYKTYNQLLDVLGLIEAKGHLEVEDLPEDLQARCARARELILTASCLFEAFKVDRYWQRRFDEGRELVAEQLKGVSQIIEKIGADTARGEGLEGLEERLREEFRRRRLPVSATGVGLSRNGQVEVTVTVVCSGNSPCRQEVAALVSRLLGRPFSPPTCDCVTPQGETECTFRLYPALNFTVATGVAKMGKDGSNVSGDSHAFVPLRDGRLAIVMSDGMGAGPQAALESSTTVSLLEHLLESGFAEDLAVKTVNALLALRGMENGFTTVDLAVFDLYSGRTELIKVGAMPSFLMRGGRVVTLQGNCPPAGILSHLEVASVTKTLEAGDMLVMVTDGVFAGYRGPLDREEWFRSILAGLQDLEPQTLAEVVLTQVLESGTSGGIPDDITVVAAQLRKTNPA